MNEKRTSRRTRACIIAFCVMMSCFFCVHFNKIENLGIFGESRKKSVVGQDGCTPVPLGDIMMWTFGDTILGSWKGSLSVNSTFEDSAVMKGMISNSLAFSPVPDDRSISALDFTFYREKGDVAQFIKPLPGEDPGTWRFWAIDGIQIASTVYVYYIIVKIDRDLPKKDNSFLPIRVMGVGLAEWKKPPAWRPGDTVAFARTARLFYEGEPVFGDSVIRQGDYLYLIGHGPAAGNRVPAYISRVLFSSIKQRAAYQFMGINGGWSSSIKDAKAVIDDVMGEPSLSYNEHLNRYIIIYCGTDGKIKSLMFDNFQNIANNRAMVLFIPPPLPAIQSRQHLFYYSGKEVFHTDTSLYAIYINPAIYQPILLKIPYLMLNIK